MPLFVNEIFYSLQGESLHSGRPCVFVRLTGCNLRCRYCDTTYAYEEGKPYNIQDIFIQATSFHCNLIEITGGEPLLQPETPELISKLLRERFEVLLETNGSVDISIVPPECIKILDIKCPSSGESEQNNYKNILHMSPHDQIKFVIGNREDYHFAKSIVKERAGHILPHHILFSPVASVLSFKDLAEWILEDHLEVRFHLQLHKIIWPGDIRGK